MDTAKELGYGAASGVVGKFIEYPFDTVKVRLQSSSTSNSTWSIICSTYKNEGIFHGFYQGIRAPLIGACLENAILFATYNTVLEAISKPEQRNSEPLALKCISGGAAGFMASFVLTPIELVKCQLQVKNLVSDDPRARHLYSTVVGNIIKKDGIKGLWKGLGSTLMREILGTAIWFGTYETVSDYLNGVMPQLAAGPLISGAIAGVTFNTSTFPIDTIKSNIQTSDILGSDKSTFWGTVRRLGIRRMYSGLGITLFRCVPANAMIFYTYEILKEKFD